jgi:hypothetical protein
MDAAEVGGLGSVEQMLGDGVPHRCSSLIVATTRDEKCLGGHAASRAVVAS